MRRSTVFVATAMVVGASVWWLAPPAPRDPEVSRNVVVIVVDTLRADHIGAWGYPRATSPNIDRLAASGVRYARAASQAPWTAPSVGSLLTGQYPRTLGMTHDDTILPQQARTLAEELKDAGYATAAVVSHSFCGSDWQFDQGFDRFDETNVLGHLGVSSPGVTDEALSFLDETHDSPFFLWLHYFDPHYAYQSHASHAFEGPPSYSGPIRPGMSFREIEDRAPTLGQDDVDELIRHYDTEIGFTDHHIGRVLDRLDELGISDETMVVFTADHGEEFLERNRIGHGRSLFEEVIHVPLIVRCPGLEPHTIEAPVGNIGVFATVLACVGLDARRDLAQGPLPPFGPAPEYVFSQTSKRGPQAMLRAGKYKLIARGLNDPEVSLFDLDVDPMERHDLATREGALLKRLSAKTLRWDRAVRRDAMKTERIDVDGWLREHLEALGYTESD